MTVYLVGAGPGDPGLLTVRGHELLRTCDVLVHDRLVDSALLDLAPPLAERIDVGKVAGARRVSQAQINAILIELGRAGKQVVRLKGGDPFVFGRGAEEVQALVDASVDCEWVPGVSAAIAAPAAAGISLTKRGGAASFTVVTGQLSRATSEHVPWSAIASTRGTIVIMMAAARIGEIAQDLRAAGLPPTTPVTAIRWATTPRQTIWRATLDSIGSVGVEPPATIIVGSVAKHDMRHGSAD